MSYKEKIVTLAVVVGGYQAYDQYFSDSEGVVSKQVNRNTSRYYYSPKNSYRCDGRVYCSQMTSREEAEYFIKNCLNTKMDGDRDGIPCERDSRW